MTEVFISMRVELIDPRFENGNPASRDMLAALIGDASQFSTAPEAFEAVLAGGSIIHDGFSLVVPERQSAWVLTIDHRHGTRGMIYWLEENAHEALFQWVEEFWTQDGPKGDMPDDHEEAVKAYFDFADESYTLIETVIE